MSRAVNAPFEKYQSARVKFVTTVADLASRPQHIEALHAAGTIYFELTVTNRRDESVATVAARQCAEHTRVGCHSIGSIGEPLRRPGLRHRGQ